MFPNLWDIRRGSGDKGLIFKNQAAFFCFFNQPWPELGNELWKLIPWLVL